MSKSKAQKIVNQVDDEFGISLVMYQNSELEALKDKIEEFLELNVPTEELADADDRRDEFGLDEIDDMDGMSLDEEF